MGRTGCCRDNAVAESLWASLKKEMYHRRAFESREAAKVACIDWIERSCNRSRPHSAIGYRHPADLMAEFQNYKKRVAKEKNDIREYATEKLVMELLPVLDNFERALAASAEDDPAGYAKGMELIFTQMVTELQKSGLAEVEAEGQDFDPTKHNAVMTEENEELESGKVSKVLQKGYALNDKVIRPSMVAVTK